MTYVKLEDAVKAVADLKIIVDGIMSRDDNVHNDALDEAAEALRSLPTDDGWEDIAKYEGSGDEYLQVWCECEDSGMRWTTVAYRTCYELWFNDLEGYVPAKGYRPLPAPPAC